MLAICNANEPVAFKAPKPSSIAKRVSQGTKPGAQPRYKKKSSSKQTFVSNKEATKGESSKAPTGSKTGHSKKRKENDASTVSTTEAAIGNSAPNDFIPQQQGINEGTKNTSYDHLFADLDSREDDPVIIIEESNKEKNNEIYATENVEIEDTLVPKYSSLKSSLIQELTDKCTNISKITRKPSKIDKHGHEERKSTKEARNSKPKLGKVKKSKLWSTSSQLWVNKVNSIKGQKPQNIPFQSLKLPNVTQMVPKA
ncbi:hypothetical protein Tco_1473873 [Tanacetum coccineum]